MRGQDSIPPEQQLLDYANRLERHLENRRAIHVRLSRLQPHHRNPSHLRVAAKNLADMATAFDGQSFALTNGDLVAVVYNARIAQVDEHVLKLRYMFSEDPLTREGDDNDNDLFCRWFDLESEYAQFLELVHVLSSPTDDIDALMRDNQEFVVPRRSADKAKLEPLDPTRLGRLRSAIITADLSRLVRRQMVAIITADAPPKPIFNEVFISIPNLGRQIMPDVDLQADPWLFQYLTEVLDRRVLKLLPEQEAKVSMSTSININLRTVMSDEFQDFGRALRQVTKKSMILEFQPVDVVGDMASFLFVRDFARRHDFRVCIDGLNHLTFPFLRRETLDYDLVKLVWQPELKSAVSEFADQYRDMIAAVGPGRIVLCHCDSEEAVTFGRSIGLSVFQGTYVDELLQKRQEAA